MNGSKAFLITNNASNHSAEDWAVATADHLVHVRDGSVNSAEALRLEIKIVDILTAHHHNVKERKCDVQGEADEAFEKVITASKGTAFETLWSDEAVQDQIYQTLFTHFNTSADLEARSVKQA